MTDPGAGSARLARGLALGLALAALAVVALLLAGREPDRPEVGTVRLLQVADATFERYIVDPDPEARSFIAETYWRMRGFAPFFDRALGYAPPSAVSVDAYALYRDPDVAPEFSADLLKQHPDWVLRDEAGKPLYIPFNCEGGSCPQFAADFGNLEWRRHLIAATRELYDAGYAGVHVDDVNMEFRVGDGNGDFVPPVDPRMGQAMTLADWRRYMAEFMEEIRLAFPDAEISHNALWFAGHEDPYVVRELRAADLVQFERGFSDDGLVSGDGDFGFDRLLGQLDWLHDNGIGVIHQPYALDEARAEFELAAYFATDGTTDSIATTFGSDPGSLWPGWTTELGSPEGPRYEEDGLIRRDFELGSVALNPPGGVPAQLDLDEEMMRIGGEPVSNLELGPGEGAVLTLP